MPTPNQQAKLAEILKRLREDNPDKADTFRLSKAGESIAHFDGVREAGTMLYSTLEDDVVSSLIEIDGRTCGMSVSACCYEGFPDPPKPSPRFAVGDWVRYNKGISPSHLIVKSVTITQTKYNRSWMVRYKTSDPTGPPGNYFEAAEGYFDPISEPESEEEADHGGVADGPAYAFCEYPD